MHLPAGVAGLDAGLAEVEGDALALRTHGGREAVSLRALVRAAAAAGASM